MNEPLKLNGRRLWMHKGIVSPSFSKEHILSNDPWLFVELRLKQDKGSQSLAYWQQAQRFSEAAKVMPIEAAPLALYYCFLNATKALLSCKNADHSNQHGVGGTRPEDARASLSNEQITLHAGGVLPSLSRYFGDHIGKQTFSLSDILWNIPFIHRAYLTTYTSKSELFIPIEKARYTKKRHSSETWFEADVVERFSDKRKLSKIPDSFELSNSGNSFTVRRTKRFKWYTGHTTAQDKSDAEERLRNYHAKTRRVVVNIAGQRDLWYLKRINSSNPLAEKHVAILIFAAMHRLSELSRYDPNGLDRHLAGKASWLLADFINGAMDQFIDQISTEITGYQFWAPKTR